MHLNKYIVQVFVGCCTSAILMEVLMSRIPQSNVLITFLVYLFVSVQGFIWTSKFGTVKPKIPLQEYTTLVGLFFVTNVGMDYVYVLHVPPTLHMIIRSASSPASMLVSWYYKKQVPKLRNAIGSVLITTGVISAMYGGVTIAANEGEFIYWCIGVAILLGTLITGVFTGLHQEILFDKYGKHPEEMMYYTFALPMPFFLIIYPQMRDAASTIPTDIWFLIIMNIISQFYCTYSVHKLATNETSVTVTFILTLRKFISLLISSIVFRSNLTIYHIVGTFLVIFGTYVYFDIFSSRKQRPVSLKNS